MSNSVILQVDESTKGLMEEIQSGITSYIEDGMREVKDKVASVDDNTDLILRKFKNFDGLSSTIEQLRSLAEESKKFTAIVSPLENTVSEIKKDNKTHELTLSQVSSNIDLLVKGVVELSDVQNKLNSDINTGLKSVLNNIEDGNEHSKLMVADVLKKMSEADILRQKMSDQLYTSLSSIQASIEAITKSIEERSSKIEGDISKISNSQEVFVNKYSENESAHQTFEDKTSAHIENLNNSIEKIQATLDIIVNLVTPFWKKWK